MAIGDELLKESRRQTRWLIVLSAGMFLMLLVMAWPLIRQLAGSIQISEIQFQIGFLVAAFVAAIVIYLIAQRRVD